MDSQAAGRNVTYRDLKRALTQLGLTEAPAPGYLVYEDSARDLVVVLPPLPDTDPVRPVHLSTARWTVVEGGVTDAATFEELLLPAAPRPKARTRSADAPPVTRRLARRRPATAAKQAETN